MKAVAIILALFAVPVFAGEADDLAKLAYQEAGGQSIYSVALTACSAVNRAKLEKTTIRGLVRRGIAKWKPVPKDLRPYFLSIARTALTIKSGEICKGANAWNRGKRPNSRGKVKQYAGRQTFYVLAEK